MIEINSNHLIVGQIKELLSSFNLPSCRIYTRENQAYYDEFHKEKNIIPTIKTHIGSSGFPELMQYVPYLKDNKIQYYICEPDLIDPTNSKYYWHIGDNTYVPGLSKPNFTKKLQISNNLYDSYTHEYLGNYLRFKRDYDGINLMPLYNCFSGRVCNSLNYSWKLRDYQAKTIIGEVNFNSADTNYKIYMLPVKLFKEYTIAIDCATTVEICCGLYGKYQDTRKKVESIPVATYKKYNNLVFSQPVIYSALTELTDYLQATSLVDLAANENDLKLFIKLPNNNESSIVVLEGDYRHYNDSLLQYQNSSTTLTRTQNYTQINFEYADTTDFSNIKLVTPLQLLRINTKKSYAFADRLIEYLCGNAIDSTEELVDNVRRIQKTINLNVDYYDKEHRKLNENLRQPEDGVWSDIIKVITYDKFNRTTAANNNDKNHDIIGYIDKDIESNFEVSTGKVDKKGKIIYTTMSAIDLYTDKNGLYSDLGEDDK